MNEVIIPALITGIFTIIGALLGRTTIKIYKFKKESYTQFEEKTQNYKDKITKHNATNGNIKLYFVKFIFLILLLLSIFVYSLGQLLFITKENLKLKEENASLKKENLVLINKLDSQNRSEMISKLKVRLIQDIQSIMYTLANLDNDKYKHYNQYIFYYHLLNMELDLLTQLYNLETCEYDDLDEIYMETMRLELKMIEYDITVVD